jgi:hypothetical protein
MRNRKATQFAGLLLAAFLFTTAISCRKSVTADEADITKAVRLEAAYGAGAQLTAKISLSPAQFTALQQRGYQLISMNSLPGGPALPTAAAGPTEPVDCDELLEQVVANWPHTPQYASLLYWANKCCCPQYYCWTIEECDICILFMVRPNAIKCAVAVAYDNPPAS